MGFPLRRRSLPQEGNGPCGLRTGRPCQSRAFCVQNIPSRSVAQHGSAPALGAGGRWFESSRSDHKKSKEVIPRCGVTSFCLGPDAAAVSAVGMASCERHEGTGSGTSHVFHSVRAVLVWRKRQACSSLISCLRLYPGRLGQIFPFCLLSFPALSVFRAAGPPWKPRYRAGGAGRPHRRPAWPPGCRRSPRADAPWPGRCRAGA